MRIRIVSPFRMQWESGYAKALSSHDVTWCHRPGGAPKDCTVFMWCNEDTIRHINEMPKKGKYIVFIRRYEYYAMPLEDVMWDKVDAVVMVNDYLAEGFRVRTGVKPHVIYNGVTMDNWNFKPRTHGSNVAMVGYINQKKNFPLALQIMAKLPPEYTLHIAGAVQCPETQDYLAHMAEAMAVRVKSYGHVKNVDEWLEDKNYLLNTSISEGCPNSVNESLSKGIKCAIHDWPGAREQFPQKLRFRTVDEAVALLSDDSPYESEDYRMIVSLKYGDRQYRDVVNLIEKVCGCPRSV